MGLPNQLSDFSSESFTIIAVVLIAKSVRYLHSLLTTILHSLGLYTPRFDPDHLHFEENPLYDVVGSGLAGIVLLCEQLNLNRACSYIKQDDGVGPFGSDCVVCLNRFNEGDRLRELQCRHVFHKDCLDGWMDQLNFSCPICRAQLVDNERVEATRRRVTNNILASFPFQ
ncbi:hypothetical protein ACJIZ3_019646 [Penstemon smallii]|uniref:RING-type domain-containing protein n=1 Tax=Penstemon smallii TaxID=265156 RepID=A0ABD3T1R6_9LAMI